MLEGRDVAGSQDGLEDELGQDRAPRDEFAEEFGEPLARALDLSTWQSGADMDELYLRMNEEYVAESLRFEQSIRPLVREHVFGKIRTAPNAPADAGVYRATPAQIERTHKGILFTGAVEAADGTHFAFETSPLTVHQIGVCTVSYHGDGGTYMHRLYRRDLRQVVPGDIESVYDLLDKLTQRDQSGDGQDTISRLARRAIMEYAERAALLEKSSAPWRMGHGNPAPYELLTGAGSMELLDKSLEMLRGLLAGHKKWLFVPSAPNDAALLKIGWALDPLEYAIVDTYEWRMRRISDSGSYDKRYETKLASFVRDVGPQIVVGLYKASRMAPPFLFYAHADYAHEAALIALADSTMHEHRGFPLLIDLADRLCTATFGGGTMAAQLQSAFAAQDAPFEYLPERSTRRM